jgi:hypothetical protein
MNLAVGWLIESRIRNSSGSINIALESVTPSDDSYEVIFKRNGNPVTSEWVNEYGIWRICKFGDFTSADKKSPRKERKARSRESGRLRTGSGFGIQFAAGGVLLAEPNDMFGEGNLALGLDVLARVGYYGIGVRCFVRENPSDNFHSYFHLATQNGFYLPIKINDKVAFIPHANIGLGFEVKDKLNPSDNGPEKDLEFGVSFRGGLQFTTAAVPGLFLFADYQYNAFFSISPERNVMKVPHAVHVGLGYTLTF